MKYYLGTYEVRDGEHEYTQAALAVADSEQQAIDAIAAMYGQKGYRDDYRLYNSGIAVEIEKSCFEALQVHLRVVKTGEVLFFKCEECGYPNSAYNEGNKCSSCESTTPPYEFIGRFVDQQGTQCYIFEMDDYINDDGEDFDLFRLSLEPTGAAVYGTMDGENEGLAYICSENLVGHFPEVEKIVEFAKSQHDGIEDIQNQVEEYWRDEERRIFVDSAIYNLLNSIVPDGYKEYPEDLICWETSLVVEIRDKLQDIIRVSLNVGANESDPEKFQKIREKFERDFYPYIKE